MDGEAVDMVLSIMLRALGGQREDHYFLDSHLALCVATAWGSKRASWGTRKIAFGSIPKGQAVRDDIRGSKAIVFWARKEGRNAGHFYGGALLRQETPGDVRGVHWTLYWADSLGM